MLCAKFKRLFLRVRKKTYTFAANKNLGGFYGSHLIGRLMLRLDLPHVRPNEEISLALT